MDDIKKGFREAETEAKKPWRNADGEEDLGDKIANAGDEPMRVLVIDVKAAVSP